jgi:hypothetical protein
MRLDTFHDLIREMECWQKHFSEWANPKDAEKACRKTRSVARRKANALKKAIGLLKST